MQINELFQVMIEKLSLANTEFIHLFQT